MKSTIALVQGLTFNVKILEGNLFLILWFVIPKAPDSKLNIISFQRVC